MKRQKVRASESVPGREFAWKSPLLFTSPWPESCQIAQAPSARRLVANVNTVTVPLLRQKGRTVLCVWTLCISNKQLEFAIAVQ